MPGPYRVYVDDNFHYADDRQRWLAAECSTLEEALTLARRIVDQSLHELHVPGMQADALLEQYLFFGDDPFIVPAEPPGFSARDYARERIESLCKP